MLDKSIPYKHVVMKRSKGMPIIDHELPAGYSFASYFEGREADWARIETSVGEFEDEQRALQSFNKEFFPHADELKNRMIFVQDGTGNLVATLTAWWKITENKRDARLHWVAVSPEVQGKGIGKAIVAEGLRRFVSVDGDVDVFLSTQTWSYPAIRIYLKAGFEFLIHETFGGYKNENEEAIEILKDMISLVR